MSEQGRIEIPSGSRTAPEQVATVPQPPRLFSTNVTYEPAPDQVVAWEQKAARLAPNGPARQLVVCIEIEIWTGTDEPLAGKLVEAINAYLDQGQAMDNNGSELVLPNGAAIRHRFMNRYFAGGELEAIAPPASAKPLEVLVNDPRLQA